MKYVYLLLIEEGGGYCTSYNIDSFSSRAKAEKFLKESRTDMYEIVKVEVK
jgi:hypothetical protein